MQPSLLGLQFEKSPSYRI